MSQPTPTPSRALSVTSSAGTGAFEGWVGRVRNSPALIPIFGVMAVAVVGLSVALATMPRANVVDTPDSHASALSTPSYFAGLSKPGMQAPGLSDGVEPAPAVVRAPETGRAAGAALSTPVVRAVPVAPGYAEASQPQVAACQQCGTVESVTPVQRTTQTSGVGAVAGGVVGGLLGNQVGGGNGRAAMTVLGAVGGGFAGNAIERNMKTVTRYQMRVRMQDGSVRTIEQGSAVALGAPVSVEGRRIRVLRS